MSIEKENIPQADMLMGSMRSMGYSFEAAIADVIDNSISAHCTVIQLFFPDDTRKEMAVGILDDGIGLSSEELFEAMRYGSTASEEIRNEDDFGRFGLGLKSASLSQCRILTVVSKKENAICAYTWNYNHILKKKKWIVFEHNLQEISKLPYVDHLLAQPHGSLVIWRDFDILDKSSDGLVFDALNSLKISVEDRVGLIFHRFLSAQPKERLTIRINNAEVKAQDPFLENHPKTTTKKEKSIEILDSHGNERLIKVKAFILPFATDLRKEDKKLLGGIENLRARQGFYIYRNRRLIIWGTWFGMKQRAELTKNARVRVDIPNSLDDIWNIDIKKQVAIIPKRILNKLKNIVTEALEISVTQQTHRGRVSKIKDNRDYIWNRMQGRDNQYFYEINRDSRLFSYVRESMSESDFSLFQMFLNEVERNIPVQQLYIDQSNSAIIEKETDSRENEIIEIGVSMVNMAHKIGNRTISEIIDDLLLSEPFCNYDGIKEKLLNLCSDGTN